MDSIPKLLQQVRRKQLLVCAYPPAPQDGVAEVTLADASQVLDLTSTDCMQLLSRLHRKQLIEQVPTVESEPLVLTAKGRRLVQRMAGHVAGSQPLLE